MACPFETWRGAAEPLQQATDPSGKGWQSRGTGIEALRCVMVTSGNQASFISGNQLQSKVGHNLVFLYGFCLYRISAPAVRPGLCHM